MASKMESLKKNYTSDLVHLLNGKKLWVYIWGSLQCIAKLVVKGHKHIYLIDFDEILFILRKLHFQTWCICFKVTKHWLYKIKITFRSSPKYKERLVAKGHKQEYLVDLMTSLLYQEYFVVGVTLGKSIGKQQKVLWDTSKAQRICGSTLESRRHQC